MNIRTSPWMGRESPPAVAPRDSLVERLEGHIENKIGGRIRDLRVELTEDRIIIKGKARSHHAKQLAHEAALDLTDGTTILANHITVS